MSIVSTQQLSRYFEQYTSNEVTFNKQVIAATGLVTRNVYLKVLDRQWPCIVVSSSMAAAKVIADVKASFFACLSQTNNRLALRWCFKLPEKLEPITFFVTCHAAGFTRYAVQNPDVQIIALEYAQRPPDDLIQILGSLLEANSNSQRRKDERIAITPETMKKLGLESREAILTVDGVSHRCVLRDLSFSGAKVLMSSVKEPFVAKGVSLKIARGEQAADMTLAGVIRRVEDVGGRKDILTAGIAYSEDPPMTYKLLINSYLTSARKSYKDPEKPAAPPAEARKPPEAGVPAPAGDKPAEQGSEPQNG